MEHHLSWHGFIHTDILNQFQGRTYLKFNICFGCFYKVYLFKVISLLFYVSKYYLYYLQKMQAFRSVYYGLHQSWRLLLEDVVGECVSLGSHWLQSRAGWVVIRSSRQDVIFMDLTLRKKRHFMKEDSMSSDYFLSLIFCSLLKTNPLLRLLKITQADFFSI